MFLILHRASSRQNSSMALNDGSLVTGVSSGKVSITARLDGAVARKTVFVYEAVFLGESQMEYGSYLEISFLASPGGGTWDFVSSDSAIACIDRASDGDLKGVYGLKVGEAVVTASRTSNPAIAFQHPVKVIPCQLGSSSVKIIWPGTMSYAYTGNPIDSSHKNDPVQHVFYCYEWDTLKNNGNTFLPGHWFSVHDNVFDKDNWEYLGRDIN